MTMQEGVRQKTHFDITKRAEKHITLHKRHIHVKSDYLGRDKETIEALKWSLACQLYLTIEQISTISKQIAGKRSDDFDSRF